MSHKKRFCIYVVPDDSEELISAKRCFKKKKEATTFAFIETKAGLGETYYVKDRKTGKIF